MEEVRSKLVEILKEMHPDEDIENSHTLIDGKILDSFDLVTLLAEINDAFEVAVSADKIVPKNFNSVDALAEMVWELMDEEDEI